MYKFICQDTFIILGLIYLKKQFENIIKIFNKLVLKALSKRLKMYTHIPKPSK